MKPDQPPYDLFIIGGGINGCGIARDAVGRGLSVGLAEMNDLASATSSASTKLFHGGLRYLEYFEVRLVREALIEREVLLRAMPHISWPMRFVLPYSDDMRFDNSTPVSRLLGAFMPWMKGRRPAWLIRMGLFLYDHLGGRKLLPGTKTIDLHKDAAGGPLQDKYRRAFEYSDCWIQDARLVVLNAQDAQVRGADIATRTKVVSAKRLGDLWQIKLLDQASGTSRDVMARMLVNAGGPWVSDLIHNTIGIQSTESVRLVRGSHIVTRKLFDHDKCYFFQGRDGRIIFAIPYEQDFTLIGTTDAEHGDPCDSPEITLKERDYLLEFASQYFKTPVTVDDIVWTYSGVRPLYDDGASSASAATRDYVLSMDVSDGAPLLSVFGGKITTYRKLAESVMAKMAAVFPEMSGEWTATAPLPGGDFPVDGVEGLTAGLMADFAFLGSEWAGRLIRTYGTQAREILGAAKSIDELGQNFGVTVTGAEIDWVVEKEWVRTTDDFLWRRTKLGLSFTAPQTAKLAEYLANGRDMSG
ncbi:MAG: glycerol-3-phosphate dehydrogenase [Rhodobacteraceae bacterium]|nr:glycerol-3-phosphate dehydrogenase [Paracoccaceae bacterium]